MRDDLPSGTVTFLFTDVEGSTRLLHELGPDGYAYALAEHRRLVRKACRERDGVEVDTQGDAFFFAFPTAPGGLAAASAVTEALSSTRIRVRVGLHTGTPHLTDEGYVGDDVHFAARVAACGHGGQIVLSSATAELVEISLTELGSHRLKDIDEAVSLFQVGEGSFPPLKTIANTNLPTPVSSFLGREAELYEADLLLQDTRLLTVTGPGGAGKTRFALELARRAREERFRDYADGVFSCFLAPLRDPALVLTTIAQALSVREQPGTTAFEALAAHLEGKKMLLLLDNLEHLLECARALSELLQACPGLTLLVTSRELLRIQGELPYLLPPLPEDEGIVLFCERARVEPSGPIAELCSRLDGLPLALELAAARTRILTPAQLLERLSERLDLLKGGRDADPRQETLRATIEWSYDLLSPEEQQLFARLSVFHGGCTLEAAHEIAGADLDTFESLLDKSLLRRVDTEHGPRYWMLETIREFAGERLEGSDELAALRDEHLAHFRGWAELVEPELKGAGQHEHLDRLEADHANLRAALDHGLRGQGDAELAAQFAVSLMEFWDIRGHYEEAHARYDGVLERRGEVSSSSAAEAIRGSALIASRQGDMAGALRLYTEAVDAHERAGSLRHTARALGSLAFAQLNCGDAASAVESARRSVVAAESDGDPWTIACAVAALAATQDHDLGEAEALYEESLQLFTAVGDSRNRAVTLLNLAGLAVQQESYDRADSLLQDAAAAARLVGDEAHVVGALTAQAEIALRQARYREAGPRLGEALVLGGEHGLRFQLSRCLLGVALLASMGEKLEAAARLVGSARSLIDGGQDLQPGDDDFWESTLLALEDVIKRQGLESVVELWRARPLEDAVTEAVATLDLLARSGSFREREVAGDE